MFSMICSSCTDMIKKWELLTVESGSAEIDVWPYIDNLAGDVISRTAFGSCYEEGQRIFRIQKEQIDLMTQRLLTIHLPGGRFVLCFCIVSEIHTLIGFKCRFIPTRANRKFNENNNTQRALLMSIIDKRKKAMAMGEGINDDLLGILLKSNIKEIEEDGVGMSMEDVIEECKLFYVAGSETTSNLIVWTMVCLSLDQEWQTKARDEIMQVFGNQEIHFEGLKHLNIVTMILNEVLRLYPPGSMVTRATHKETQLGDMMIPSGVHISIPIMHVHHDPKLWGEDATLFKPERFLEGIMGATKGKGSGCFLPFSGGPRVCIGQNFAMIEAKTAIAKILQRFSFEFSPSYKHSPFPSFTLPPQFGVHLILHADGLSP
ncbi:putative 11-oxo-beta-amyrin 30-oxidase [Helianthus anomalus]